MYREFPYKILEDEMKWLEISDVLCILCMHKVCHCITCIGIRFKSWELLSNTWTLLSSFHSVFIPSHRRLHGYKVLNTNHKCNSRVTMLFKKEYKYQFITFELDRDELARKKISMNIAICKNREDFSGFSYCEKYLSFSEFTSIKKKNYWYWMVYLCFF